MDAETIRNLIETGLPGARADVHGDDGVHFEATVVCEAFAGKLPLARQDIPAHWRFDNPSALPQDGVDNVFEGWHGDARIAWPGSARAVPSMNVSGSIIVRPMSSRGRWGRALRSRFMTT